jgi:hypothetical protein
MTNNSQVIDLASGADENVTQTFNLLEGSTYWLTFQWLPPAGNPLANKSMTIFFNEQVIDTVYINQSNYQIGQINSYSR